ncbi:MAG: hypothetical protein ACI8W8_000064 [Rhodothermales bacterium]|jgi:hypothetical protein
MGKLLKPVLAVAGIAGLIVAVMMFRPRALYTLDPGRFGGFDWKGGIERSAFWTAYFEYEQSRSDFSKPLVHFSVTTSPVKGLEEYGVLRYVLHVTSPATGAVAGEGSLDTKPVGMDERKLSEIANIAAVNLFARKLSSDADFAAFFKSNMPGKGGDETEIQAYLTACIQAGRSAKPVLGELLALLDHEQASVRKRVIAALRIVTPESDRKTWEHVYTKLFLDAEPELCKLAWADLAKDGRENAARIGRLALEQEAEWQRLEALYLLIALGPAGAGASPSMLKLVKDPACPETLMRPAVLALSSMLTGDPVVMGVLRDIAKDGEHVAADIVQQGFFAHTLPGSIWKVHDGGKGYRFEFRGNGRYKVRNLATSSVG